VRFSFAASSHQDFFDDIDWLKVSAASIINPLQANRGLSEITAVGK
jgi:hypothetical protein